MSEKPKTCIFCAALEHADEAASLIVHRGDRVFSMLNRYPYANGHVMVAPVAHEGRLFDSDGKTLAEMMEEIARTQSVLLDVYHPSGFNVGANFGKSGGAGVEDHYHFHVVPRWDGDTNFMTVTGGTRVIPEELPQTWRVLAARFEALPARSGA
jgi:ATP adenylyltransferase